MNDEVKQKITDETFSKESIEFLKRIEKELNKINERAEKNEQEKKSEYNINEKILETLEKIRDNSADSNDKSIENQILEVLKNQKSSEKTEELATKVLEDYPKFEMSNNTFQIYSLMFIPVFLICCLLYNILRDFF